MMAAGWRKIAFLCALFFAFFGTCRPKRFFTDPPATSTPFSTWKLWKTYGDFNNSANWGNGHIPCSGDRVVFPKTLKVMAYFGSEPTGTWDSNVPVQIRELQLPHQGVIALPWDGEINFMGDAGRTAACPGTDVLFTTRENFWLDPWNWEDPSVPAEEADAVPHLRRIPCGHDVAVFKQPYFRVLLPDFPVRTGAIYLFTLFFRERWDGLKHYFINSLISPLPEAEESPLRLAETRESLVVDQCGLGLYATAEETQQLMDAVCRNVNCPPIDCVQPVRPHLHCCHICGAVVELEWSLHYPKPDINSVRQAVRGALEDADIDALTPQSPVAVHASFVPTRPGLIQVVVLQKTLHGDEAQSAAAAITTRLKGWSGYGVSRLVASGGPIRRATTMSVLSTFFLPLLAAIAAIAAILFYLGEVRSFGELGRQLDAVVFARFENISGADDGDERIHVQIDKLPSPPSPPLQVRSARGSWTASPRQFQNPLFNELPIRPDDTALAVFSCAPDVEKSRVTHENPLYAELLKREKELESTLEINGPSSKESETSSSDSVDTVDTSPLVDIDL